MPSTVTERVSIIDSDLEIDVCSGVTSSTANPELTLFEESELGKL